MSDTWALPQPWTFFKQTKDDYTAWALEQEKEGRRLVVEYYYDAYPDGGDWDELWLFSQRVITDYRTGAVLYVLEFEDEQPATPEFENLLTVERVLTE